MTVNTDSTLYYTTLQGITSTPTGGANATGAKVEYDWRRKYEDQVGISKKLQARVDELEKQVAALQVQATQVQSKTVETAKPASDKKEDDFDLFEEDEEADKAWEERIQKAADDAAAAKAAKDAASGKEKVQLKSIVVIDVKPWEDTTDLKAMEEKVREIEIEGLEWKASKLIPIGYGIRKLQISCHVLDNISVDDIQDKIQEFEDYVQSTDVVSFTKL